MISPFKTALGFDYKDFENRLQTAIHLRFGLPAENAKSLEKLIKKADRICAYFEAVQLAGFAEAEAKRFFGAPPKNMDIRLRPQSTKQAQESFLERFGQLRIAMDRANAAIGQRTGAV